MANDNFPGGITTEDAVGAAGLIGGATPFGWVSLGASLLKGLGGGIKIEKSGAFSQAEGGYGQFMAENKGGINSPFIELDNPAHVAIASVGVVLIVYAVKKWGK